MSFRIFVTGPSATAELHVHRITGNAIRNIRQCDRWSCCNDVFYAT